MSMRRLRDASFRFDAALPRCGGVLKHSHVAHGLRETLGLRRRSIYQVAGARLPQGSPSSFNASLTRMGFEVSNRPCHKRHQAHRWPRLRPHPARPAAAQVHQSRFIRAGATLPMVEIDSGTAQLHDVEAWPSRRRSTRRNLQVRRLRWLLTWSMLAGRLLHGHDVGDSRGARRSVVSASMFTTQRLGDVVQDDGQLHRVGDGARNAGTCPPAGGLL